ncbi:hypothetical protein GCM10009530_63830 [Microbispora corallina]|uniref:Uncharacterized protein n=1 Tax=Microbispora corallina TaxID=83302 RepID=A0ABQ4GBZ1_9ACTN|nr:hypothetical protein [Microbispora corallina]GIH44606.1 hypothetical protein Mco01_76060 [Microbispora corallina]
MATHGPQVAVVNGAAITLHSAAAGDKVSGIKKTTRMLVVNGSGSAVTLTIDPPGNTDYGVANPAKTYTIPANSSFTLLLLPSYRDPADSNLISLAWSSTTTVTWAVIG